MKLIETTSTSKIEQFYKDAVTGIAKGMNLTQLASLAYTSFHIPLIIVDAGYHILAYNNGGTAFADPYWNIITQNGGPTDGTIINYYLKEGFLDRISKENDAIYTNWGICKDYPQTSGAIYVNHTLEGFVSVLFMDPELLDFSLQLNTTLCQLASIIMRTTNMDLAHTQNPVLEMLAQNFFDVVHFPELPNLDYYQSYIEVKPKFLILILTERYGETAVLKHVQSRIKSLYSDLLYQRKNKKLYLFMYNINDTIYKQLEERFITFLRNYNLVCGCSGYFTSLEERDIYIQQAECALSTGTYINSEIRLFHYEDNYINIMLYPAIKSMHQQNAIPAPLKTLAELDAKNNSDYIDTLKVYLFMRNDMVKAASALHLHRNTLSYRLTKIMNITGMDINDPNIAFELQVGIAVLELFTI